MDVEQRFKESMKAYLNQPQQKWLLAVSGGVDSMVLLDLVAGLPAEARPRFGIAHLNHGLRASAAEETEFLATYCADRGWPFHPKWWEPTATHVEEKAREARYQFFEQLVREENYTHVFTAHHQNDQVETFLQKFVRGSRLRHLVGIRQEQQRLGYSLVRPLLEMTKRDLRQYAQQAAVLYFEDETNQSDVYQRNRIRHQVLPLLVAEQPHFFAKVTAVQRQIDQRYVLLNEVTQTQQQCFIKKTASAEWQLDRKFFQEQSAAMQEYLIEQVLEDFAQQVKRPVLAEHQRLLLEQLRKKSPGGLVSLPANFQLECSYDRARIYAKEPADQNQEDTVYEIRPEEQCQVSAQEYFRLETAKEKDQPNGQTSSCWIPQGTPFPLRIRRVRQGDRFVFDRFGHQKKVARYFIDAKIPHNQRAECWIVEDNTGNIIWIAPLRESYLSIPQETDKIHYRLVYQQG